MKEKLVKSIIKKTNGLLSYFSRIEIACLLEYGTASVYNLQNKKELMKCSFDFLKILLKQLYIIGNYSTSELYDKNLRSPYLFALERRFYDHQTGKEIDIEKTFVRSHRIVDDKTMRILAEDMKSYNNDIRISICDGKWYMTRRNKDDMELVIMNKIKRLEKEKEDAQKDLDNYRKFKQKYEGGVL